MCGESFIHKTYARGRGIVFLLLGLVIFGLSMFLLFTSFPSALPWAENNAPLDGTWAEILIHDMLFAIISASGLFTIGFGLWLITTPHLTCRQCGHTWWDEPQEPPTAR